MRWLTEDDIRKIVEQRARAEKRAEQPPKPVDIEFACALTPEETKALVKILDRALGSMEPRDWPPFVCEWLKVLQPDVYAKQPNGVGQ